MNSKTHATKLKEQKPDWYIVDAKGQILGRLASKIAPVLMGKNKTNYVPYLDMGDHVVVINAKEIEVTGNKEEDKMYRRHTGYPGGLRELTLKEVREKKPVELLNIAIKGMMPKTRMGRTMMKKLHVFPNDTHKYTDKKLITLE